MKVIRLNENDIERLVKKIIKEDNEWFDDTVKDINLVGIYTRTPVQKLDGMSGGEVLEVTEVDGQEATVFISYNLKAVISGYPYSSEGPYYMDVNDLIQDITDGVLVKYNNIGESRLFNSEPSKLSPDERIANYILEKLEKERPDIQHQFVDHTKNVNNFYDITVRRGVMEADLFRVDFNNQSARISQNPQGFLIGGDFGVIKVYNVHYRADLGQKTNCVGYAVKMTGEENSLKISESLAKRIFDKVEDQYGDIRVFKAQRRIDKGTDDESDLFDQIGK